MTAYISLKVLDVPLLAPIFLSLIIMTVFAMPHHLAIVTGLLLGLVVAQTPGSTPEVHPKLKTWKCTKAKGCTTQNTAVVLDSGTHWMHQLDDSSLGCTAFGGLNTTICPDAATCATNCVIEGISNYSSHGVTTQGSNLILDMLTDSGSVLSPRVYLLAESEKAYENLQLTGNEISFTADVSKLPCGMNGALYLSEMNMTGGLSSLNPAGAQYGTGYCDAQCGGATFLNGVVRFTLFCSLL